MKLHRPILKEIVYTLAEIFSSDMHADKLIEKRMRAHKEWGARDRRFFAETLYDMVRWWRLLWNVLEEEPSLEYVALWRLLGTWLLHKEAPLPELPEWKDLRLAHLQQRWERTANWPLPTRESVPDWLFEQGEKELGSKWPEMLHHLNLSAPVFLRANRLKTTREELLKLLNQEGVACEVAMLGDAIRLAERKNVFTSPTFKQGLFEMQDLSSQQVAPLLQVEPGMRVIDACAGAGGKTLHLAALMKNKGKILALDIHDRKLEELRRRSTRAGADCIETRVIDSGKMLKRMEGTADRLLLDVPCTGLGVLRRNPDAKWKLTLEELQELRKTQAEILGQYSRLLKPGGLMVYATCSILPSENQNQVAAFLAEAGSDWKKLSEESWYPNSKYQGDGFYAAVLQKNK